MALPDYQSVMLPLLQLAGDSQTRPFRATVEPLDKKDGVNQHFLSGVLLNDEFEAKKPMHMVF